ncbi:MAG: MFS transporter, partial [Peptococcaceae bacterium]|nr:MFS transporter [Peptococcaceae bacterium]
FSNLSNWGLTAKLFVTVAVGLLIMGIYVAKSWNKEDAVLSLYVLRHPRYVAALFADCMNVVGLQMIVFVLPLFLQNGLGLSAALTGTILLPVSLVVILAMPIATKILTVRGEKALAIIGVVFLLVGSSIFLKVDPNITVLAIIIAMCVRSFGMAFLNLMATNTCMASVPAELSGHASALRTWMNQMLTALVVSMASTIISIRLTMSGAQTAADVSAVYISSTELLFAISYVALLCIIPVALKFFRGKNEMNE